MGDIDELTHSAKAISRRYYSLLPDFTVSMSKWMKLN